MSCVFADYIYVLLNKAQREFHEMFTRTYGTESMQIIHQLSLF